MSVNKMKRMKKREIKKLNAKYYIYYIYINIINNKYRVYETRIVRRKGNSSDCGARARVILRVSKHRRRENGGGAWEKERNVRQRDGVSTWKILRMNDLGIFAYMHGHAAERKGYRAKENAS